MAQIQSVPVPPTTVGAAPWYKAPTFITAMVTILSAACAAFPKTASWVGFVTPDNVAGLMEGVGGLAATIGAAVTAKLRASSKIQPLTMTQAAADVHPATLEAEAEPLRSIIIPPEDKQ